MAGRASGANAVAMDGRERADNLSVNDLEALLLAKRRRQTAARVRRIAEAEATPDHRLALPPGACGGARTRGRRVTLFPYTGAHAAGWQRRCAREPNGWPAAARSLASGL